MRPSARRRVERELQGIIERDGDVCSVCGRAFPHNSKTVGGVTLAGTVVLVGECCARKVSETVISGLYLDHPYDVVGASGEPSIRESKGAARIEKHIEALQDILADVDKSVAGA